MALENKRKQALKDLNTIAHLSRNPAIPLIIEIGTGICEGKEYPGLTNRNLHQLADVCRETLAEFNSADYLTDISAMNFCNGIRLEKRGFVPNLEGAYNLYNSSIIFSEFAAKAIPAPVKPDIITEIKEILKNNSR